MSDSVTEMDIFKDDVESYFRMIKEGQYYNGSFFVSRMEDFLEAWLAYSYNKQTQIHLQQCMRIFAEIFGEEYYYKGAVFSGRHSGKIMTMDRVASWSPDYNVALSFALSGENNSYGDIIDDEEAEKCLVATKYVRGKGDNFYLSLFLERVVMRLSDNDSFLNVVSHYLDTEDEVISLADETVEYFTHKETLENMYIVR